MIYQRKLKHFVHVTCNEFGFKIIILLKNNDLSEREKHFVHATCSAFKIEKISLGTNGDLLKEKNLHACYMQRV